jgi:hypothetical protein
MPAIPKAIPSNNSGPTVSPMTMPGVVEKNHSPSNQSAMMPTGVASHAPAARTFLTPSSWLLKGYLVAVWTVTIEEGVNRGSPLEKWIVAGQSKQRL